MTKILFVGHIHEGETGWGRAIQGNIRALVAAGYDVVCRSIRLNKNIEPPDDIKDLLNKSSEGCEILFQHLLPHYVVRGNFKKNIAYFVAETINWDASGFHHYLNLVDLVLVPNTEMEQNCKFFIKVPVKVVPHSTDIEKYVKVYNKLDLPISPGYNFYFVGEFIRRKRLSSIIQAFNAEFKKTEPVNLILKINKSGLNPQQLSNEMQGLCTEVKKGLKLHRNIEDYPNELIISSFMTDDEIMGLHNIGDCFISGSYGEAWNWGVFDAVAMGNTFIHTNQGGPKDFLTRLSDTDFGYLVDGRWESAFGAYETFPNYNSSNELWYSCDILQMRSFMRGVYEKGKDKLPNMGLGFANEYSYVNVGERLKEVIGD